jgi:urease accessory protein
VDVIEEGQVLMTTPSATKIYRSAGATAVIEQRFRVEEGAALEWLPQETIAFDGSRSRIDTTIDLEDGAVFIGWDTLCLGRPAAAEAFESGRLTQRLRLRRNGRMLVEERLGLRGAGAELEAAWGLQGSSVLATMVVADTGGDASHVVRSVRDALPEGLGLAGVTAISGVLVCRVLADSARVARVLIHAAWGAVRPEVLQRAAIPPRIWAT